MIIRKFSDKRPKIVIFQGSPRDKDTCPHMESKTQKVIEFLVDEYSFMVDFVVIDLSVNQSKQPTIQPCKGCVSTAGGYHCHWKCVSEDQRVHTINGFKRIKDLGVGEILQDGNKVIAHLQTSESEEIFEVKLKDGRRIELTKDHRVKVLSKERFRDIESNWKFYRKEIWVEVQNLNVGDLIPSIQIDDVYLKNINELDLDYLLYGLLWGDGTFANNTPILYVDKKENHFLEQIASKLENYIISVLPHEINQKNKLNPKNDTEMLKINFGAKFGRKMKSVGFEKNNAKIRRLPIDSFDCDSSKIFSFLNGWISTDGSVHKKGISIYNTSYDCLRDLQLLLSRVGIKSSISDVRHIETTIRNKKSHRCSSLNIIGYDSVKKLHDNLKLVNPKKQYSLEKYILNEKKKMVNKPSSIKSIKPIGLKPVYDIEVENSHQFNCEGINIHNCSCYTKGDEKRPDLMYEADIYDHLETCDAFMVFSPVHWYSVTSQVKALFDRLVCANQTLTREQAIEIMGKGNAKNPDITGPMSQSGKYDHLLKNHLEGKYAAFYLHGDNGANDYQKNPKPESLKNYELDEKMLSENTKIAVMPIVTQCRYSGINVPDDLIETFYMNQGEPYYTSNIDLVNNMRPFESASNLLERLLTYLQFTVN